MAVTTLDPKTALIVIDLQHGIAAIPTVHALDTVVSNASALAEAFRRNEQPVVLVNVVGAATGRTEAKGGGGGGERPANWADLMSELNQQPGDHTVSKQTWGAFTGTGLDQHLKDLGVTQVVIVGVATSIGVESTARHAHENGFHVTVAVDAMTDMDSDAHDNSVQRIFPRLDETGTTREIIDLLDH